MSGWGGTAKTCRVCGHDAVHRDHEGRCARCIRVKRFVGSQAASSPLVHALVVVVVTLVLAVIVVKLVGNLHA